MSSTHRSIFPVGLVWLLTGILAQYDHVTKPEHLTEEMDPARRLPCRQA
jgi:hypothetical protein